MQVLTASAEILTFLAQALTPLQRWRGARRLPLYTQGPWLRGMLTVLGLAMVATLVSVLISRIRRRRQHRIEELGRNCLNFGLSPEEQEAIFSIARLARAQDPAAVLTMESDFDTGCAALLASGRVRSMSRPERAHLAAVLASIREKLGYREPELLESKQLSSTREIPPGSRLTVHLHDGLESFEATLVQSDQVEMVLQPEHPVAAGAGQLWVLRYCQEGAVMEFDAPVLRPAEGAVVLRHCDLVRFINRRRFPRVPVQREALLAAFPFLRQDGARKPPDFLPAKLVEIAGPGLRLEARLELDVGQRCLAVVELDEGKVIQGLGKVRRSAPAGAGAWSMAVELLGLTGSDLGEMVRQTNLAARANASGGPAAEPEVLAGASS